MSGGAGGGETGDRGGGDRRRGGGRRRLEAAVGWLLAGMAVAWGLAVAGAWIEGRAWIAVWADRTVVTGPAARPLAWRVGERTFLVDEVARPRRTFEQWLASVESVEASDPRLAGRPVAPAPRWFRLALRQDAAAAPAAEPAAGRGSEADDPPPGPGAAPDAVRAIIVETRGGWPWRVVVNRSVSFLPGITIEPMDTPSLSADPEGRQRLPMFPLGGPLVGQGAAWAVVLAAGAATVRRARRRARRRAAARAAGQPARRWRHRLAGGLRLLVLGTGLAVLASWAASVAAAPRLLGGLAADVDAKSGRAVHWERTMAHADRAYRLSVIEASASGGRAGVSRLVPLETPATGLDPLPPPLRAAIGPDTPGGPSAGPTPGRVMPTGGVVVAEVVAGWPFEAVRRRQVWPAGREPAAPAAAVQAAPPLDPVGPGLWANALLLAALVAATAWSATAWLRRG